MKTQKPKADPMITTLCSIDEAAERLHVSARTVRREIAAGNLQAVRIGPAGRLLRIENAELDRYVRRRIQ